MENLERLSLVEFWRGKRVLLTGHTGFKGSWLAHWLHLLGAHVTGFALAPETTPSLFGVAHVEGILDSIEGDLRSFDAVQDAVRRCKPDIVLHLGAQALVRRSYVEPVATYATNVMGLVHVLQACVEAAPRVVLVITSDKCYAPSPTPRSHVESDPMGGHDPYSTSKGCAELIAASYRGAFLTSETCCLATARAGNVIGGGDWSDDRLIPDFIRAWSQGRTLEVRSPKATRPWQHVMDALYGYLKLVMRGWDQPERYAKGYNFGPRQEDVCSVAALVEHMNFHLDVEAQAKIDPRALAWHEAAHLELDTTRAAEELDWHPVLRLEEAIEMTASWYRGWHHDPAQAREMTTLQLERFMERLTRDR